MQSVAVKFSVIIVCDIRKILIDFRGNAAPFAAEVKRGNAAPCKGRRVRVEINLRLLIFVNARKVFDLRFDLIRGQHRKARLR